MDLGITGLSHSELDQLTKLLTRLRERSGNFDPRLQRDPGRAGPEPGSDEITG